jgi:tetratricopeptide (TPR) repeat protein
MGLLGAFDEGKTFLEKGLRNAFEINDLVSLAFVEMHYGFFCHTKGEWKPSKEHFERSIKHSEKAKYQMICANSLIGLGYACAMLGDPETGKRHAEKGLEIYHSIKADMFLSWAHLSLGSIHFDLGDLKNARSFTEEALRLSKKNNEKHAEVLCWLFLGTMLGKTEPLEINKAEGCILKGIKICKESRIKAYYPLGHLYLGELYLNAGEKEKAIGSLKEAEQLFREMGMEYWLNRTRGLLEKL